MKLNYEFGFLAKECPLMSRELVRPWRLAANPPRGILKTTKFGIIPPEWRKEGENEEVFERVS